MRDGQVTLTMDEYQRRLVWNPGNAAEDKVLYCLLGLAGETGELMELVKKRYRDWGIWNSAVVSLADDQDVCSELGDVLWYLTKLCDLLGLKLSDVAQDNLDKLTIRAHQRRRDASISLPGVDAARPPEPRHADTHHYVDDPYGNLPARRYSSPAYRPPGPPWNPQDPPPG